MNMDYFLNGLGIVVGVFAGAVAGTLVTIAVQLWWRSAAEKQQKKNLRFELQFNSGKIDSWLDTLAEYRNAINGNTIDTCFTYFDLSQVISFTIKATLESGLLHRTLTPGHMGQLLAIFSEFALSEQFMNSQFSQARDEFVSSRAEERMAEWDAVGRPKAVKAVDYWEGKLRAHKSTLAEIAASIK